MLQKWSYPNNMIELSAFIHQNQVRGSMSNHEKVRLKTIEEQLKKARNTLEGLIPIWTQVDRKVKSLEAEIRTLEDQRLALINGQTAFEFKDLEF